MRLSLLIREVCFWTCVPGSEPLESHLYLPGGAVFSPQNTTSAVVRCCASLPARDMFSTHESSALCSVLRCGSSVLVRACQQDGVQGCGTPRRSQRLANSSFFDFSYFNKGTMSVLSVGWQQCVPVFPCWIWIAPRATGTTYGRMFQANPAAVCAASIGQAVSRRVTLAFVESTST